MLLKLIALIAAAIPMILFVRAVFFRGRPSKLSLAMKEFNKQIDIAFWLFLGLIGCVVAFGLGKLLWTWFSTP